MEHLLEILVALIAWRLVLSILLSVGVGLLIAFLFPTIGAAAVLVSLLTGIVVGMVWQSGPTRRLGPEVRLSRPVAFLGLALIGAVWGGLGAIGFGSASISFVVLVLAPFLLAPLLGGYLGRKFSVGQLSFASCSLVIGFLAPYAMRIASE